MHFLPFPCMFSIAGREQRDKSSGAVEVFTKKNASGGGHLSDPSKQKVSEKALPTKDEVGVDCSKLLHRLLFIVFLPTSYIYRDRMFLLQLFIVYAVPKSDICV